MAKINLKAHAKINLFLDILDKREDGYHNIRTVFQEISLADEIEIKETSAKSGKISVKTSDPALPSGAGNLAYKAAAAIKKYSGVKKGVEIFIKKNIPVGAGLGGGSSDAASVLTGLNRLWKLKLNKKTLCMIGKSLGADVPFFIYGGRCLGEGIGDILTPLHRKNKEWYVIVYPRFEISTKYVYDQLTERKKKCIITNYCNKLESVVLPRYPEIGAVKRKLKALGAAHSLMSGSGSCVFGVVKNEKAGKKIMDSLKGSAYKDWLVHSVGGNSF